jgi:hypothetical protein
VETDKKSDDGEKERILLFTNPAVKNYMSIPLTESLKEKKQSPSKNKQSSRSNK